MRMGMRLGVLCLLGAMTSAALAAETRSPARPSSSSARSATKFCDPVCELNSQDAAFAILVEVFRQHQSYRIESDFQSRLQQAAELKGTGADTLIIEADSKALQALRDLVRNLARHEKDLRLATMETQVANFQAAYSCVRKIDEDYVGERVPRVIDQQTAQNKIKEFVVIAPGTLAKGDILSAPTIPASSVLLNLPTGPANTKELVEPCD